MKYEFDLLINGHAYFDIEAESAEDAYAQLIFKIKKEYGYHSDFGIYIDCVSPSSIYNADTGKEENVYNVPIEL